MKRQVLTIATCVSFCLPAAVAAQDDAVIIPSQMELNEAQQKDLKKMLHDKLTAVVKQCVAEYPRPEFFGTLAVEFQLRKSGDLRGGFVPSGVPDSNMYVKSDEERAKLEEAGSFARRVVRNDRDLDRCLKKGTREFDTDFNRYSATVSATYTVSWKGKDPKLEATSFEVKKS